MDEKEKNCKPSERSEDFSQDCEQDKTYERFTPIFAWWYSFIERVFNRDSGVCSDVVTILLGICSLLLLFAVLLFSAVMAIKGVQTYNFF